jgi:hypothetical protein
LRRILECQSGIGGIAIGHLYPPLRLDASFAEGFIVVLAGPRTISPIGEA